MTLWIILTFMTTLTALLVAIPLIRRIDAPPCAEDQIIEVGRDQLAELSRDLERGQINKSEADAAKTEIERRIVTAARAPNTGFVAQPNNVRTWIAFAIAGWLVAGATLVYVFYGQPDLPARPFAAANSNGSITLGNVSAAQSGTMSASVGNVEDLVANLEARLQGEPDDAEGLRMLAWSYFNTEKYKLSAQTYAKSVALDDSNSDVLSAYAEARVRAANGLVDDETLTIVEQALTLNPLDPRAGFFLGMASEQAGDAQAALDIWGEILVSAPLDAEWRTGLIQRIEELAAAANLTPPEAFLGQEGIDLPMSAQTGPSGADIAAAEALSPQDRQEMIDGIVEGLAARLKENPDDPDGWVQLMRSYTVMGNDIAALDALISATNFYSNQPDTRAQLIREAGNFGIEM